MRTAWFTVIGVSVALFAAIAFMVGSVSTQAQSIEDNSGFNGLFDYEQQQFDAEDSTGKIKLYPLKKDKVYRVGDVFYITINNPESPHHSHHYVLFTIESFKHTFPDREVVNFKLETHYHPREYGLGHTYGMWVMTKKKSA